jgi:hypothetical protein
MIYYIIYFKYIFEFFIFLKRQVIKVVVKNVKGSIFWDGTSTQFCSLGAVSFAGTLLASRFSRSGGIKFCPSPVVQRVSWEHSTMGTRIP